MAITGDAVTDAMKQTVIAALVQRELIAQSKLLATVTDVTSIASQSGQDELEFPRLGSFTVTKKVSGTPVTDANLTYGTDKLLLNQHAVIQWLIEKKASKQSAISLEQENLTRAVSAHAKQVDVDIHAELVAGVSASGPDHIIAFNGPAFDKVDIVKALELLDLQEIPSENRYLAVNPAEYATMLNIDNFIDASKFGSNQPVLNGQIGLIFGMPVIKTTVVAAGRPMVYHKEALAIGFQLNPEFDSEKDLPNLAIRYSLDQLYGMKTMLQGKGIVRLGAAA